MILELKNVCKSFHQPRSGMIEVLNNVNFSLDMGETNAITGQSGSGKTTLLSLIAGLDIPDSGKILLQGEDLCSMKENRLSRYRATKIGVEGVKAIREDIIRIDNDARADQRMLFDAEQAQKDNDIMEELHGKTQE